jgi:hypothetical protein
MNCQQVAEDLKMRIRIRFRAWPPDDCDRLYNCNHYEYTSREGYNFLEITTGQLEIARDGKVQTHPNVIFMLTVRSG